MNKFHDLHLKSMTAIVNTYNGTIRMADETVLSIMAINKLWIPDVLIDIIKDYLYIDAYTVWRNYSKLSINQSITSMEFKWYDLFDEYGRKRITQWTKGFLEERPQIQSCTCVTCGENSAYHTNLDGCCAMEKDHHEDGDILLSELWGDDQNEGDDISYQNQDEEYDW
jgi:hypothetical protein